MDKYYYRKFGGTTIEYYKVFDNNSDMSYIGIYTGILEKSVNTQGWFEQFKHERKHYVEITADEFNRQLVFGELQR